MVITMKFKNSYLRLFILVAVVLLIGVGLYFSFPAAVGLAKYLLNLFMPFIIGYLYVSIVRPFAKFFSKRLRLPNGISAIIVMILSIGVVGGIISLIVAKIVDEIGNLYMHFPAIYESAMDTYESTKQQLSGLFESLPKNIQISLQAFGTDITEKITDFINSKSMPVISYAGATAKALPKIFIGFVVFLLSSFFMLSEPERFTGLFKGIIPDKMSERWNRIKSEIKIYLGGYAHAQGIIMSIVFFIILIGLSVLNVSYSLLIAIGIAVLDALPFFGSGAVLWPWALVRFINGDIKMGISLMVIYIIIVITRQMIEPKIVSKKMGTNSMLTLMSMYVGYKTFSIGGMILGPITMLLIISLYRAGLFDGLVKMLKHIKKIIKSEYNLVKNKIKELGE